MDATRQGGLLRRSSSVTVSTATLGLFLVLWTFLLSSSPVIAVHPPHSYLSHPSSANCAYMSACQVTDMLMQEINALKEKITELVNFQVDVNRFKFEHGIHRSEMEKFRQHVEAYIQTQKGQPQPAHADKNGNDVGDGSHADAPKRATNPQERLSLPSIHNRLEQVENTVRQWDENILSSTRKEETIRQTLEREEGTRKVLEDKIGHLQKKMDEVQTLVKDGNAKAETMKNELWDIKQATNKHETALGRQQDSVQNVNQTLRSRVGDLEDNVGYFTSNLFQLSYRTDEFHDNVTREVEILKKTTNSKFNNVTGHLSKMSTQLSSVSFGLLNVSSKLGFIDGDVTEVKMQVETFVDRMFTFDMLFTKHNKELQAVRKTVHDTNITMQGLWESMRSVVLDVEDLKSDVTNWEEALMAFNTSVAANNQEIETLWQACEANLTNMRLLLRLTDQSIDDFRTSISIDVKRLVHRHNDMEKRMDSAEAFHKSVENEVKSYEMMVGKYESEIKYLKEQTAADGANLKTLKNNVKLIQNSLDAARKYQTELKTNVTELMELVISVLPTKPSTMVNNVTDAEYITDNMTTMTSVTKESVVNTEVLLAEPLIMLGEAPTSSTGCLYNPFSHPNVVTSIGGRPIRNVGTVEVKEGVEIVHRCKDIGLFQLEGDVQRICLKNGTWSGIQPVCHKLATMGDFMAGTPADPSAPPAIEISPDPESTSTGVTPNGSLVVTPGSRFVLGCVFPRIRGYVSWIFTPSSGSRGLVMSGYWSQNARNEVKRLSARPENSGQYTCRTSEGANNTIDVIVKDVNCSSPPDSPYLHILDPVKMRLNSRLKFTCKELGYVLSYPDVENNNSTSEADNEFRCLASGEWSRDFPICVRKLQRAGW